MTSFDEKRATPRHELTADVTFESQHNFYTGVSRDLGGGGLFVATDVLRPTGECVRVRFTLPGSAEILDAIAEVRWVRSTDTTGSESGMGLQFLQMSAKTREAVAAFMRQRAAMVVRG